MLERLHLLGLPFALRVFHVGVKEVVRGSTVVIPAIEDGRSDSLLVVAHVLHHLLHDGRVDGPRRRQERRGPGGHPYRHRLLVAALDNPGVRDDLVDVGALVGVGHQHLADEVAAQRRHKVGDGVLGVDDLLVELHERVPVERQLAAHKHVQQHTQAPAVHLGPRVLVPLNELG